MKIRLLLSCLLLGLLTLPAIRAAEEKQTKLGARMEKMNGAYRKLRGQVADASKTASSLEFVATIRESAEAALTLTPEKAADLPEADRAKFVADFQARMKSFLGEIAKLEAALKAGNNEEAGKIYQGLGTVQREAHKEFQKKKPEPPPPPKPPS